MKKNIAVAAIFAASVIVGVAGSARADDAWGKNHQRREQVNQRLENQNRRINKEMREGDITKEQAQRMHRETNQIREEERSMAKQNHGHITKEQQQMLNRQENGMGRRIGQ